MKYVKWFKELSTGDISEAGGKGANLGELTQAGIPVPPGFIVLSHSYFHFLKESGLEPTIAALLSSVVAALQACWASLVEARAIFYRANAGFDHLKVGIAVPVQRMVQSNRSGVMFTLEPVSGDKTKIVIEAIYGLGEAIATWP